MALSDEKFLELYFPQTSIIWNAFKYKDIGMAERDEMLKPWRTRLHKLITKSTEVYAKTGLPGDLKYEDNVIWQMTKLGADANNQSMKAWFTFVSECAKHKQNKLSPLEAAVKLLETNVFKMK